MAFILLASLILNLWGVTYGLPQKYYPDEGRMVNHALAFGLGDFNPHYFNYPSFCMYFLFALYGMYYFIGHLFGLFRSVADFQQLFFANPTSFYLIGRVWIALAGTAVVAILYGVGKEAFRDKKAGLYAALFFAPLPYFVFYSHFIVTDIPLLFFILLSYLFTLRISRRGKIVDYALAGAAAGLGIATKYSPILLVLPLCLAHVFNVVDRKLRFFSVASLSPLALALALMILFFFIGSPYCFLDYREFFNSFKFRELYGKEHTFGTRAGTAWLDYPKLLFIHPFLIINRIDLMGIVFIGGLAWALYRRTREDWLLLLFPLALYLVMGRWTLGHNRYALPLIIILSIWGGRAVSEIDRRIAGLPARHPGRLGRPLIAGLAISAVGFSTLNAGLSNRRLSQKDTRTLAKEWIETYISPGTKIALEWDDEATVQLWEAPEDIQGKIKAYAAGGKKILHHSAEQMAAVHQMRLSAVPQQNYRIVRLGEMDGTRVRPVNYSLDTLRQSGVEYVVTSGEVAGIFASPRAREIYPEQVHFYEQLEQEQSPIKVFLPNRLSTPGPLIKIYKLNSQLFSALKAG